MSSKHDKGALDLIKDFYTSSRNFLVNCQKPDKKGKYKNLTLYFRIYIYC